jgi:hypothetical protein
MSIDLTWYSRFKSLKAFRTVKDPNLPAQGLDISLIAPRNRSNEMVEWPLVSPVKTPRFGKKKNTRVPYDISVSDSDAGKGQHAQ